ncbi:hypothetical protein [Helicobacter didelphidarum]|nr:hypothetical protein [Helicobacter didelphidarum]
MKKIFLAILLLFSVAYTAEQPLPMELLDTWESVDDKIVKLKRHALFVCLQRFNPQSDFVDKHVFSHNHPEVWHMIPPKLLDELVAFTHKTILEANSGTNRANIKFSKTYNKQDTKGKNPDYTNACLNLYDSRDLMREIVRILDQIYLNDTIFPKEYQKRYKKTIQKYCKECK